MQTSWLNLVTTLTPSGWQPDHAEASEKGSSLLSRILWLGAAFGTLLLMMAGFAAYLMMGDTIGPGAPPSGF